MRRYFQSPNTHTVSDGHLQFHLYCSYCNYPSLAVRPQINTLIHICKYESHRHREINNKIGKPRFAHENAGICFTLLTCLWISCTEFKLAITWIAIRIAEWQ